MAARQFTTAGAVTRITNPSPRAESGESPSGQSYSSTPPNGVRRNSSTTVITVGSVVHAFAAVNPVFAVRPYAWTGVTDVDAVPGAFVANVHAQISISAGAAVAVVPSKLIRNFFRSTPWLAVVAPDLTPRPLLAVAAARATTAPVVIV